MPILKNARWERFAQARAQGKTPEEAYELAGYKPDRGNAARLTTNDSVGARISEILLTFSKSKTITIERVAEEVERIGFIDITDGVKVKDGKVLITDTDQLPPAFRAAIASLKQTKDGVEVKFHDKMAALAMLGKHKGMFKENVALTNEASLADLVIASYEKGKAAKEG